jgi:RNA polymerase sigma factor (sigma-70 family)
MEAMPLNATMTAQQNEEIGKTVRRERKRLLDFIKQRVPTEEDAEDILQDVFYQFTNAYRGIEPIEKVTSWLFTVARNRITDFFRKKKADSFSSLSRSSSNDDGDDDQNYFLEEIMQDVSESPEGQYIRSLVWDTLNAALEELPEEQREIFTLHELEGVSFKEMSEKMKLPLNTLLSRKRYAVLHLRTRLQSLYDELLSV